MEGKNTFVVKGAAAELKWGYQQAAVLTSWQITGDAATATVVRADEFKVSQRPLTFVAHTPNGHTWTWPVESLQISGDQLSAQLGSS